MKKSSSRALALLALASLVLSGCAGGESDAGPAAFGESDARDPELAHIEGQVLDEELRALNATVSLPDQERVAQTDAEGRFLLLNLEPGTHTVLAYAVGYEPQARAVTLEVAATQTLLFTLRALPANGTYYETYPYVGHEPCQWYIGGTLTHCTFPYTAAHGFANQHGVNLTRYGVPPDLQQNKAFFNFSVRLDHTAVVSELVWKASSAAATIQALIIMCPWYDPVFDECVVPGSVNTGTRYYFVKGTNPIRHEWKHPQPKHLEMAPFVWSRANVNGDSSHPVGIAFEQKVEFFNTVFYGAPPPEGFTAGPRDG